jgi:hypothetical protein
MLRMHKRMMRNREGRKKGAKRQKEFRSRIWQSSRDWACDICHPCVWHRRLAGTVQKIGGQC